MLSTRCENLKMVDEETIIGFDARPMDTANESAFLCEDMSDAKLVRKVLRFLIVFYTGELTQ